MKIVFTGPECTGKSTISAWLSEETRLPLVSEVARNYLDHIGTDYTIEHVREIGILQHYEESLHQKRHQHIICDTDVLTVIIWMGFKYHVTDDYLFDLWLNSSEEMYFLCYPDFPWEEDPLRENPHDRDQLFDLYRQYLTKYKKPYVELSGPLEHRQEIVKSQIFEILGKHF